MKALIHCVLALAAMGSAPYAHAQEISHMKPAMQDTADLAQRLIDIHFSIWNDADSQSRELKFDEVYTHDFFVADQSGVAAGYAAVNRLITQLQGTHAGFLFAPAPITWNHGVGRVVWNYGPPSHPDQVHGEDIFTVKDGKLASAHVFLDRP
ncbi:nuclear transport factor 2 family protein [Achromobacter insolitus]|uniref:nuclear transport factor 2 family protein n=1 Tax=Achromobacter insolitus TaxID=217204 RepID=UPI001CD46171|nr:nuclear transport factor 2 family protein [Achromobacter insolitus]